ncbi:c(7)-type cytochrome triheme domain-containing protein [Desulfogranum mediterraneum]|uniref:c(7)-type cytochrome triheme domain-containing protein n=1 Tax=Desulfogranum mediterraneum TaxID=160661 RepID=UPI0009FE78BB|nr:c(7)-type cytochrome triheme domain-containing protein [Desulfogranum mediterraneum]
MRVSLKLFAVLGMATVAGVSFLGATVQATAPAQGEEAVEEKVFQSYGDTLILAKEPVDAMFSHKSHVIEYELSCDSCHPDTFERRRGAAKANGDYTMASLEAGLYCGTCHDGDTAFSSTEEESCVTCHGSDMVEPETIVFVKPVKAVIFDHGAHTEMGFECASCHDELFKMRLGAAEEQPEKFTMAALYEGKYCGACHNGDDAFASDTLCTTCHIGVKGFERMHGGGDAAQGKDH